MLKQRSYPICYKLYDVSFCLREGCEFNGLDFDRVEYSQILSRSEH